MCHLLGIIDDGALRNLIKHLDYNFQTFLQWNPYINQHIT